MTERYMLEMSVTGTYVVEVGAESLDDAMKMADALYRAADFGVLENPDREYTWYSVGGEEHTII